MQTKNYYMDLMIPNQISKDVVYNESIVKIDSLLNIAVISFIDQIPEEEGLYILSEGEYKNYLCYIPHISAGTKLQKPSKDMVFYIKSERNFFLFNGNLWEAV